MRKDACFYLGRFSGLYSFKGELLIKLDTDDPEYFTELESILVDMPTGLVPFFISDIRLHKSSLLRVKLETIDSEATAKPLLKNLYISPWNYYPNWRTHNFTIMKLLDGLLLIKIRDSLVLLLRSMIRVARSYLKLTQEKSQFWYHFTTTSLCK